MKVKLYFNLKNGVNNNFIISKSAFTTMWEKRIQELVKDEDTFSDWLLDTYTAQEIFDITDEEKLKIKQDFYAYCKHAAAKELSSNKWDSIEIEINPEDIIK